MAELRGFSDSSGGGAKKPDQSPLLEIVEQLNARYGMDLTEKDLLTPILEASTD